MTPRMTARIQNRRKGGGTRSGRKKRKRKENNKPCFGCSGNGETKPVWGTLFSKVFVDAVMILVVEGVF